MKNPCLLCGHTDTILFHSDSTREYLQCTECSLVFVPPYQHLPPEEEKQRYDLHENDPGDDGYRRFLSRLFVPLNKRLQPRSTGLDFGSGPGPTLHLMFEDAGHTMQIYDVFYAPDTDVFKSEYDFITASEVVEHLSRPLDELNTLWRCLRPGGYLGLMTKLVQSKEAFSKWHYIRDDTHIAFFSKRTFCWLADQWNTQPDFVDKDVVIIRKPVA